ncbi:MAG: PHP domain-containing protein, partial [Deltaproteobacteria bacterium]|nr:PHP domain-containing protein [Deltaproteobacteria bacterium]
MPLWVKSHYSFLEGASSPEELVEQAHALGLGALAMTDRDGVYGLVKAHFAARERGLRLIAGAELTLTGVGSPDASRATSAGALASMNHPTRVVALAHDREGYAQLCRLISVGQGRAPKGQSQLAAHELAALTHCELLCADPALLAALRPLPVRVSAYCVRHLLAEEREPERRLRIEAQALGLPVVGGFEVLYHHVKQRPLQDVVACVRAGVTLSAAGTVIRSNAEHALLSPLVAQQRFADAPELLRRSLDVAER